MCKCAESVLVHLYLSACCPEFLLKKLQFHLDAHSCKRNSKVTQRQQQVMCFLCVVKCTVILVIHKVIPLAQENLNIHAASERMIHQPPMMKTDKIGYKGEYAPNHTCISLFFWKAECVRVSTMCADATNHT